MADTYTYSGGKNASFRYKDSTAWRYVRLDDFSVVKDMPLEDISPVGSSLGDAGSAGVASYSGSFSGRLVSGGQSTAGQLAILKSSKSFTPTSAVFRVSSAVFYKGPILINNVSLDAAGGAVVKLSGSWTGANPFNYSATS